MNLIALMSLCGLILSIAGMAAELPPLPERDDPPASQADWLIHAPKTPAGVYRGMHSGEIVLDNGLIRRTFRTQPDAACVAFDNRMTGESLLRAVEPEASLELDGTRVSVGGLTGQPDKGFLRPEWLDTMQADPDAFRFAGFEVGTTAARFPWKRVRHAADLPWPPPGVALTLHFTPPGDRLQGIAVDVHYELYTGLPLIAKWLTIHNRGPKSVRCSRFTAELLAFAEYESAVGAMPDWHAPNVYIASDYAFGGDVPKNANRTTDWTEDPEYTSQVNYERKSPLLLQSRPPLGPDVDIAPGSSLETFRTFELIYDSTDRERKGLALRRMMRTLAPWTTENPIMLHLTSVDPRTAHAAIDQCAAVGFEMVILSFGSGLNMEDVSPANLARFKDLADYAHRKGVQIGGYSLLASRHISDQDDVIDPKTGRPGGAIFGASPCLGSVWGQTYFAHLRTFLNTTGFDLLEHDGSYPGDVCASTTHPGHAGLEDSQWRQFQEIAAFYRECRAAGRYLNVPDWYFLSGSNKSGMGYREVNWSLPRAQQILHARQNMYDAMWEKTPTMGWMFVPLVQYQGGGAAATIEPLREHLAHYAAHFANNFGFGVQACYRGPRLYDSEETKALVLHWVGWFKAHRAILESDIVHVRRADARDIDCILHVNPDLPEKGLAMLYNPTGETVTREIELPLYYTGLAKTARIRQENGAIKRYRLDRAYKVRVKVVVKPNDVTWLIVS